MMRSLAVWCVVGALCAGPALGQEKTPNASAFVPAGHWSKEALRSLAALGAVSASEALQAWPVGVGEVAWAVAVDSGKESFRGRDRAVDVGLRLGEEYTSSADDGGPSLSARLRGGWTADEGALLGGTSFREPGGAWQYPGPLSAEEVAGERIGLSADFGWAPMHGAITAERIASVNRVREAYVGASIGGVDVWAGRQVLAFGPGRDGGVVLSGDVPLDGVGLRTRRALDLPGPLSFLGTLRVTAILSRLDRSGLVDAPWFTAARFTFSPKPSMAIGINRAALFGGSGNVEESSFTNVALMALGVTGDFGKESGFENQVASIDVWARSRMGDTPYAIYGELGIDDIGWRIWGAPALIVGVELPEVPGLTTLGVGMEFARFFGSCCGKPPWYRHGDLAEGWTDRGRLLAHPLGGHGSQLSINWRTWPTGPVTLVDGRLFLRSRGAENLFAPDWQGGSAGASVRAIVRAAPSLRMRAEAGFEKGRGDWDVWSAELGAEIAIGTS